MVIINLVLVVLMSQHVTMMMKQYLMMEAVIIRQKVQIAHHLSLHSHQNKHFTILLKLLI